MNFDLINTSLEKGTCLIEASAGTGKTYTIAGLYLRLLLEQKLTIQEILVVTYTNAATEELRTRIRSILTAAQKAFAQGTSENDFLKALYERNQGQVNEMREKLDRALCAFDEAAIYSIHGFCQRMLKDRAFESGALFDMELAPDVSTLLQEIADDYWRRHFYAKNSPGGRFALKNGFTPEQFLPWLQSCLNYPSLRFLSRSKTGSLETVTAELATKFEAVKALWEANRTEIKLLFGSHQKKAWANSPYNDDTSVAEFFSALDTCFSSPHNATALKILENFCNASLRAKTGKNKTPPRHAFFDACDALCQAESDFLTALQMDFLEFARTELPRRKEELKVHSFDDLLTRLHSALQSSGGKALAKEVGRRFRAALIDEFQDTDPIQYGIFKEIFFGEDHYLFLIGDPKQAIYGFRGADIFTYMKAAKEAARKFTLSENWRSETGLVNAVNTVFAQNSAPFVFPEIGFSPVAARGAVNRAPLQIDGVSRSPFEIWFFPRKADGKSISKESAEVVLPKTVAAEISRLLRGNVRIGERLLRPEDIAVLVVENRQAQLMQEALSALGIPSVQQTTASLFESREAEELHCILLAVSQPSNERLVKAALSTDLFGLNAATLAAYTNENPSWQLALEAFHYYYSLWIRCGFIQMFRELLREQKVRSRLLTFPDGERRLTNVLHLGEVLHRTSVEQRLGATGLNKWLARQRGEKGLRDEEYQLRLESDENAVKLVTIHRSKGLEYGVVFCPFSWKHSELTRAGEEQVFFHDRDSGEFLRDLGSDQFEAHRELAREEKLAENLRLLYVALTRAKHRCYFVWGHFNKAETSAPAWLFHGLDLDPASKTERFKQLTDERMLEDLKALEKSHAGSNNPIGLCPLPDHEGEPYSPPSRSTSELTCPALNLHLKDDWRVTSFSSLTRVTGDESPDYDELENSFKGTLSPIFAFPKGTRPGTCLHEIFEELNFAQENEEMLRSLIQRKLRDHVLSESEFTLPVFEMVRNVLSVPLDGPNGNLRLKTVQSSQRLSEMEFYFPLRKISPPILHKLFSKHAVANVTAATPKIGRLIFDPVAGYMKGFIDLVFRAGDRFYIVDWKSNWLGDHIEHYNADAMQAAMVAKNYDLQSRIYSVALHQYLKQRMPNYSYDHHFGGVFYIFLRGVDPSRPEFGVYRDQITGSLVQEMANTLIRS